MLKSLFYIFVFLTIGELLKGILNIPIPGSIVGMILIFAALKIKVIKIDSVKPATDKLLKYLLLFFIPYGVGFMVYYDIIKIHWPILLLTVAVSTILTLYFTALIQQILEKND